MKLTHLSDKDLVDALKVSFQNEKQTEIRTLQYLVEVKRRELHLKSGSSSMYKFCLKEFSYSKDQAYLRMRAAEVFELSDRVANLLAEKRVHLTCLAQARVAFIAENKRRREKKLEPLKRTEMLAVIDDIAKSGDAKRTLATRFPSLKKNHNATKPLTKNLTLIQFAVTKEELAMLTRLREKKAHSNYDGNWHDLFIPLAEKEMQKPTKAPKEDFGSKRKTFSEATEEALLAKAEHQCEYEHKVERCDERHGLQIDHVVPLALGGTNELKNLRIMCGAHNRYLARKMGLAKPRAHASH